MRYALVAALLVVACRGGRATDVPSGRAASPGARTAAQLAFSDDELRAFVRWRREYAELFHKQRAELEAIGKDDLSRPFDDLMKDVGRQAGELTARNAPLMQAQLDRCPLKGERLELATEATGGLFHIELPPGAVRIVVGRDEERIGAARRKFGAKAVDDILARASLILAEAGDSPAPVGAAGRSRAEGTPPAAELDAYLTGAGSVHLGMTESEVSDALGKKAARRDAYVAPGSATDVAWDGLDGPRPGAALGRFLDGRLIRVEFAPTPPPLPRIDRYAADAATTPDFVRRSVARTLRMADVEAVTRTPPYRMSWIIGRGTDGKTVVASRWIWEIEPGGQALLVHEQDGEAGQPNTRNMK